MKFFGTPKPPCKFRRALCRSTVNSLKTGNRVSLDVLHDSLGNLFILIYLLTSALNIYRALNSYSGSALA